MTPKGRDCHGGIMISDWLYELLVTVRCGSISKAALQLGLAQSVLSSHLSSLEGRLGTELLDRRPTGVVPTRDGRHVCEAAGGLAEIGDAVKGHFADRAHNGRERDVLVAGLSNSRKATSAFELSRKRLIYSGYRLNVRYLLPGGVPSVAKDLLHETADVFVTFKARWDQEPHEGLRCVEFFPETPYAIVEKSHRLAENTFLTVGDLLCERFARNAGQDGNADDQWAEFVRVCEGRGFVPLSRILGYNRGVGIDIEIPDYVYVATSATSPSVVAATDRFSVIPIEGIEMSVVAVTRLHDGLVNRFLDEAKSAFKHA